MKYAAILWTHSGKKKPPYPLKLRIRYGRQPAKYFPIGKPLGIYLTLSQWNEETWQVKNVENEKTLNIELLRIKSELQKRFIYKGDLTEDEILEILRIDRKGSGPAAYYEKYAKDCEDGLILHKKKKTRMSKSYIKTIRTNGKYLAAYAKKNNVTWNGVNENFYNRFVTFMREELELAEGTIGKSIKILKTIMSAARKEKIHNNEDYKDYSVSTPKTFKMKLTEEEVEAMSNVDLSDSPELIDEQERFIVAYNFLLRFSDSITIKREEIKKISGRWYLEKDTLKTGARVLVPLKARTYEILKRRKFKFNATNSNSNKKLKLLGLKAKVTGEIYINGEMKKRYELIETHTTRRSMATHLYNSGLDPEVIMAMGGWKTRDQMMEYIDIDLEVKAKVAAEHRLFQ
jgi:integrase